MAVTLFDLMAKLTLDTSGFDTNASKAVSQAGGMTSSLEGMTARAVAMDNAMYSLAVNAAQAAWNFGVDLVQTAAEVPLENVRAGLYEWIEDIGAILLDMMGTYYGTRPIVRERTFNEPVTDEITGSVKINPLTGQMETKRVVRTVTEAFDFDQFKHLFLNVRADVGASTYFSEVAMVQTLDNLRANGTLEILDYLERIPDKLIPRKAELIEQVKSRMGIRAEAWLPGSVPAPDHALQVLPEQAQARVEELGEMAQGVLKAKAEMEM